MGSLIDILKMGKPRLSSLVVATTAGGIWLCPYPLSLWRSLLTVFATWGLVAGANTLNCYLERHSDASMKRTRNRPLPSGRISERTAIGAIVFFVGWSVPVLWWVANPITACLGVLAFVLYTAVYTPLKLRSTLALAVGAVPGALPPLMGWTAAAGRIELGGIALFAVLFFWQIPHFLAIALYLQEDYARAGHRLFPIVHGEEVTKVYISLMTLVLLWSTLVLVPLRVVEPRFAIFAGILGGGLLIWSLTGFRVGSGVRWAKGLFYATLGYMALLLGAFAVSAT